MKGLSQPDRPTSTACRVAVRATGARSDGRELSGLGRGCSRHASCCVASHALTPASPPVPPTMRTSIATFAALIPLFAVTPAAAADEGARLLRCQQRIARAAAYFLAQRRQALTTCVERALLCPAALTSTATAADDACLTTVADRCRARLAAVHRAQVRLDTAGPRCTHSVSLGGFFGADGLSFEEEGAYCPEMAIGPDV